MAKEHLNFIGGRYVPAQSGRTYENRNPADRDDLVGTFPLSEAGAVDGVEPADSPEAAVALALGE